MYSLYWLSRSRTSSFSRSSTASSSEITSEIFPATISGLVVSMIPGVSLVTSCRERYATNSLASSILYERSRSLPRYAPKPRKLKAPLRGFPGKTGRRGAGARFFARLRLVGNIPIEHQICEHAQHPHVLLPGAGFGCNCKCTLKPPSGLGVWFGTEVFRGCSKSCGRNFVTRFRGGEASAPKLFDILRIDSGAFSVHWLQPSS